MPPIDACQSFCSAASALLGPEIARWLFLLLAAVLVWAKTQKKIVAAVEPLQLKLAEVHTGIAEIKASIRPPAIVVNTPPPPPPTLGTSSSQSGNFEAVTMPTLDPSTPKPRPSMPDPNLVDPQFPPPSAVPKVDSSEKGGA